MATESQKNAARKKYRQRYGTEPSDSSLASFIAIAGASSFDSSGYSPSSYDGGSSSYDSGSSSCDAGSF